MSTENIYDLLGLLSKIEVIYTNKLNEFPYQVNLLDEIHANENAHTRILTALLRYIRNGKHVILESYVDMALRLQNLQSLTIEKPIINFNDDFIDCFIYEVGKYAIIIENKIHWAVDQDKQIDRYISTALARGIPQNQIYVIYLTSDGKKEVSNYSYSEESKILLGNRFITMNYRDNVLPWLINDILPDCPIKEDNLITAIKQYIDHLMGMFGLRNNQQDTISSITKDMENILGISTETELGKYSYYENLSRQIETVGTIVTERKQRILESYIKTLLNNLKNVIQGNGLIFEGPSDLFERFSGFNVKHPEWKHFAIRFEFEKPYLDDCISGYILTDKSNREEYGFWKTLQDNINAIDRNNRLWIWNRGFEYPNWALIDSIKAIEDGTLMNSILNRITFMIEQSTEFSKDM